MKMPIITESDSCSGVDDIYWCHMAWNQGCGNQSCPIFEVFGRDFSIQNRTSIEVKSKEKGKLVFRGTMV